MRDHVVLWDTLRLKDTAPEENLFNGLVVDAGT